MKSEERYVRKPIQIENVSRGIRSKPIPLNSEDHHGPILIKCTVPVI